MSAPRSASIDHRFEELAVGQEASFVVALTDQLIDAFAAVSGDFNERHMGAQPPYPARLVHGALLTALFSRLVGMQLPGRRCIYLGQQTEFLRPALAGDEIVIHGEVVKKDEPYRRLEIKTTARRDGVVLATGRAQVMVLDLRTEVQMTLQGKRAIVTGGSQGIGRATAAALVEAGARVVVSHRTHGAEAAAAIGELNQRCPDAATTLPLDLGDRASIARFFDEAERVLGGLDILVNNAAPPLLRAPLLKLEWPTLARDLDLIVGGTLACIQHAVPRLIAAEGGAIVNVLSSVVLGVPPPGLGAYVAAKSALAGLTRVLAVELGPKHIRVNAVSPGLTDTQMTADIPQLLKNRLGSALPLGRTAQPEDVAGAIVFLCSDGARYLTGANLPVSGGGWML